MEREVAVQQGMQESRREVVSPPSTATAETAAAPGASQAPLSPTTVASMQPPAHQHAASARRSMEHLAHRFVGRRMQLWSAAVIAAALEVSFPNEEESENFMER